MAGFAEAMRSGYETMVKFNEDPEISQDIKTDQERPALAADLDVPKVGLILLFSYLCLISLISPGSVLCLDCFLGLAWLQLI